MKIFVFGTRRIKMNDEEWQLPENICRYLDELIAGGMEILIDDQSIVAVLIQEYLKIHNYKRVTICIAGGKNWIGNNLGKWDEKHFPVHGWGSTIYSRDIERDFNMIEIADLGMAIWDGNDFNTYANMLCLCALGKPIKLFLINDNIWIDVKSIDDIREFKGPDEELTGDEVRNLMTLCEIPDETIRSIVKEDEEVFQILLDCINQADIALEKKLYLLKKLLAKQNLNHEVYCAVERAIKHDKSWKLIKHNVRAIADYRPINYGEAEIPWNEIRRNWNEMDKVANPQKYAKHIVFGNKTITFE